MNNEKPEGDLYLQELCHGFVCCRCAMHVAHGALKGSLGGLAEDKFVVKPAWVVLALLRSSVGQLIIVGSSWINQRNAFKCWSMPVEHNEQLCRLCGMQTEVVDELLRLQLGWDPGSKQLKVVVGLLHSPTLTADVLTVLNCVWKFNEFSESRFIGMGSCS